MAIDATIVRAVCFDLDGTLSDTDDIYVRRISRWLEMLRLGRAIARERFARRMIMAAETPGNFLVHQIDRLRLDEVARHLRINRAGAPDGRSKEMVLFPGVFEMLATLHQGYRLALVTARTNQGLRPFLEHFQLDNYFDLIVTSESTLFTKPFPDPLLLVARHFQLLPEELLMVGDTVPDILTGKAVAAQTVGVLCGFGENEELLQAGADLILETTTELTTFL